LGHNVRAICWIVPKKYLLLLDTYFRSSIDRPLNGYLRIPVVITISVSRKKIYNHSLGAYEKKLFWMKWSLFYFYLTFVYNCYVPTYHRFFYSKDCFSNIKTSSKRLEYLNIFPSFFKKFNTSWNQKNTLTAFVFYLFS
jgi:hypothetical protein